MDNEEIIRISEDKCMSNKNKEKPPWDEGSLLPTTSKEGRTKMEMTALCTIVMHLSAEFLMLLMRLYQTSNPLGLSPDHVL